MRSFTIASLATAASAATQIPFFIPGMAPGNDIVQPVASIVKADPSTTIMALACPTGTSDNSECPWGELDMTVSVIAKTEYAVSVPLAQVGFDCTSKKDMTCTAMIAAEFTDAGMTGFTQGGDGTVTGTTVYSSGEVFFQTASVTAGQEKLSAAAGAGESGPAKTTGAESATAKETSAVESTLKTTGSAAAATGATPSESGASPTAAKPIGASSAAPAEATGAAARFGVEGVALLALAGAAAMHAL
ncbi:hypothetical protein BU23DRAFT_549698 [Bimuria novae-zelandiae CBS 107.79]|uniref:Uncharacterized protein n=1 Tax=Bimuria novae-zelandiae CBS 107.79 TaxID=1447943 RepID=A0A6A5W0V0_9PLEO|nr:hypothetical protein BU23DRAFT_549698 [Bimuria novae-zelandiae CBS 107.79]